MSCLFKIKQAKNTMTETERKIADYIMEYKADIIHDTAEMLAQKTGTSSAAIIRFSKKLGYKGFTSLKMDLATEGNETEEFFDIMIEEKDSITDLIKKSYALNMQNLKETYKLLSVKNMEHAISSLIECNRIFLFGVGGSGIVCRDFQHKLSRIDRMVVYEEDFHIQLAQTVHIQPNDVALAVTYSGMTKEIELAMRYAQEKGATTIAITKYAKSAVSKLVDYPLYIPIEEKELRLGAISSRFSSLMITDLLYLGVAKHQLDATRKQLLDTRSLLKQFE